MCGDIETNAHYYHNYIINLGIQPNLPNEQSHYAAILCYLQDPAWKDKR